MLPVITIIGRPNVGKSTLFNLLTQTRDAIVLDVPGVTRDRQYGDGKLGDRPYIVVDTGGIAEPDNPLMAQLTDEQVVQAMTEADYLLFMVDGQDGLTSADEQIAQMLRRQYAEKVIVVVNKTDRLDANVTASEFHSLGLGEPQAIAAKSGRGVAELINGLLAKLPQVDHADVLDERIAVAVVGRPNVGKSTLINRILGEERVVVFDRPGTTRDSIYIPFERRDVQYTLIDTAGVRRKAKVTQTIEKFSIVKTLQAIEDAHVVVAVLDTQVGITDQDLKLLGLILERGKALILAFNKWDGLDEDERTRIKDEVDRRLQFVTFARRYFISALHGTGVGKLYHAIDETYAAVMQEISTSALTKALEKALEVHQPPLVRGRRVRLRYAHLGGHNPMIVVVHGKQTDSLPQTYQRFLIKFFRKRFKLVGVPVMLQLISDDNPFA